MGRRGGGVCVQEGGRLLYRNGFTKGFLIYLLSTKGGVFCTQSVAPTPHISHIPTTGQGMSTILLLPRLLLTLPSSQAVLQIPVAPPVHYL